MAKPQSPRILLTGIGIRLICAAIVMIALWAGYFWATSSPRIL